MRARKEGGERVALPGDCQDTMRRFVGLGRRNRNLVGWRDIGIDRNKASRRSCTCRAIECVPNICARSSTAAVLDTEQSLNGCKQRVKFRTCLLALPGRSLGQKMEEGVNTVQVPP